MTAIIDYGVGNLFSLAGSLKKIGEEALITADIEEIEKCDRIILPGVGAFGDAIEKLRATGLIPYLKQTNKKMLGICLGMQLLFDKSYEYGCHEGLGLISGEVSFLGDDVSGLKIPHMGWNALKFKKPSPLYKYVKEGDYVYFVHSFYAKNCDGFITATADYGVPVTASVENGRVFGTQFHPEKSGAVGLKILKAFCEME